MSLSLSPAAIRKVYSKPAPAGRAYPEFPDLPQTQAVTVPVAPAPNAQRLKCFYNVRDACAKSSGDIAFGWAIWTWPSVNIEAIHHAVWRQPSGTLVDITPPELTVPGITFIEDAGVAFDLDDKRTGCPFGQPLRLRRIFAILWQHECLGQNARLPVFPVQDTIRC
jgi:hypothetical protein